MSPDQLFSLANVVALPAWLGLLPLPHVAAIRNLIAAAVIPCLFAAACAEIPARFFDPGGFAKFSTLEGLVSLQSSPWLLLLGRRGQAQGSAALRFALARSGSLLGRGGGARQYHSPIDASHCGQLAADLHFDDPLAILRCLRRREFQDGASHGSQVAEWLRGGGS